MGEPERARLAVKRVVEAEVQVVLGEQVGVQPGLWEVEEAVGVAHVQPEVAQVLVVAFLYGARFSAVVGGDLYACGLTQSRRSVSAVVI